MWMMHGNHDEFIELSWCLVCEVFGVGFFFFRESRDWFSFTRVLKL